MNKLTMRDWTSFLLIGLVGQFAWTIENMYFNVFLYNTISTNPDHIAIMVAASAIAATVTTLVMGALSDQVGRRKVFITWGYVLWGLSTMAFGWISVERIAKWVGMANAVTAAVVLLVVMDCVMTFFGSTANDAAFNAYITDVTTSKNRGKVESVLAVLPLISMLIIFGAFDSMTQQGQWEKFFTIFGILVLITGILSFFLIQERAIISKQAPYFKDLLYGFQPTVIKTHKSLYLAFVSFGLFSIAVQVFFPFLIIYIQNYLNIESYAIVFGIVLILASLVSIVGGRFIDRIGKLKFVLPAGAIMLAGLLGMYITRSMVTVIIAATIMMSGYMLVTACLSATIRDYTPSDKIGHFQGIRMVFAVLLPMIIGPFIGAAVIKNSSSTYVELGVVKNTPTPVIFIAAAIVLLFTVLPILRLKKEENA